MTESKKACMSIISESKLFFLKKLLGTTAQFFVRPFYLSVPLTERSHFILTWKLSRHVKTLRPVNFYLKLIWPYVSYMTWEENGDCWDVRQCFVQQFKTDYVRLIEGLVFEKIFFFLVTDKLKKLNFSYRKPNLT